MNIIGIMNLQYNMTAPPQTTVLDRTDTIHNDNLLTLTFPRWACRLSTIHDIAYQSMIAPRSPGPPAGVSKAPKYNKYISKIYTSNYATETRS